jgi:putative glutamine amidotransferase
MSSKTLAGELVTVPQANGPRTVRPLIGLPGRRRTAGEVGGFPDSLAELALDVYLVGYADKVLEAGGLPVGLPVGADPVPYLEHLDGIVLTGGADIDPWRYRSPPDGHGHYEPERDRFEFQLLEGALAHDLPVLGICRGLQVLNVHRGGSLVQDVPAHARHDLDPALAVHPVSFEPGSRLHSLYGPATEVNSLHHQCVDQLGTGLLVAGRADDGTVEAIEMPGRDVLAVQWHPEMRPHREPVFAWLVGQARSRARAPRP